jgi:hypothetical protein
MVEAEEGSAPKKARATPNPLVVMGATLAKSHLYQDGLASARPPQVADIEPEPSRPWRRWYPLGAATPCGSGAVEGGCRTPSARARQPQGQLYDLAACSSSAVCSSSGVLGLGLVLHTMEMHLVVLWACARRSTAAVHRTHCQSPSSSCIISQRCRACASISFA